MREAINISVPANMADFVRKEVKQGGFASTSDFFRHLIRLQIANRLNNDRKLFDAGKGKKLKSLKDLR